MDILSPKTITGNLFRKPELIWGVLGTARIAEKVIPAIQATRHNKVLAVASRDLARGRAFADRLGVPVAYGSYDELLRDPMVQAVYLPLPNHEHLPWAVKALQAGKHVLVEKPFALNADEAQQMVGTAIEKSLVLMENFMYRHTARIQKALEIAKTGELGKLRFIHSSFSFPLENPDDFRLVPDKGGGALYDLGCYCVNLQRLLVGREPITAQARCHTSGSGVDLQMTATLDFGDQIYGSFEIAFNAARQQFTRVVGSDAVMTLEATFNPADKPTAISIERGGEAKKINFKSENAYQSLIEHFYQVAIRKEIPLYPLADAVKNLAVIDSLFQSAIEDGKPLSLRNPA